jgi:FixJ family two-component response regulator
MSKAPLISIVDDDALARDGIRDLVESLGYNTVTFKSAEHFPEVWFGRGHDMLDS